VLLLFLRLSKSELIALATDRHAMQLIDVLMLDFLITDRRWGSGRFDLQPRSCVFLYSTHSVHQLTSRLASR
jgi:hypothetical protein